MENGTRILRLGESIQEGSRSPAAGVHSGRPSNAPALKTKSPEQMVSSTGAPVLLLQSKDTRGATTGSGGGFMKAQEQPHSASGTARNDRVRPMVDRIKQDARLSPGRPPWSLECHEK